MDLLRIILKNSKDISKLRHDILCCGSNLNCPTLSADVGNTLECRTDGLYTEGAVPTEIQYQDEGVDLASSPDITTINFTGDGVTASYVGGVITVDVTPGSATTQRFAVSGEDNTAGENRSFNLGSNHIFSFLGTGTSFFTAEIDGTGSAQTSHSVTNGSVQMQAVNSSATGISSMSIDPTAIQFGQTNGKYFFGNIQQYADNAAAISAGLIPGGIYRTGDLLKIVH